MRGLQQFIQQEREFSGQQRELFLEEIIGKKGEIKRLKKTIKREREESPGQTRKVCFGATAQNKVSRLIAQNRALLDRLAK